MPGLSIAGCITAGHTQHLYYGNCQWHDHYRYSRNFVIRFAALPDASISQTLQPVFDYSIEADVTDISGETRSSTETVQVDMPPSS